MGGTGTLVTSATRSLVSDAALAMHADRVAQLAQLRSIVQHGDAAAGSLLPTHGNRFELLEGADAFVDRLVGDIGRAEHQVNFSTYALHPGSPGSYVQRVLDALVERRQAGVRVTGIIDQVGSGLLIPGAKKIQRAAFVDQLRRNDIEVIVKPLTFGRGGVDDARLAVDHRKLFEIDARVAYQGGMNLVDAWLPWHDVMVRAEGPAAAQAGALLAGRWRDLGGHVPDVRVAVLEAGLRQPVDDLTHATTMLTNGSRTRKELSHQFMADARAVAEATEPSRLWIANPYLADPEAMEPVVQAAKAGHDVRLLLAPKAPKGEQLQDVFTDPLRRAWAWEVATAGGTVVKLPRFSHAKAWLSQVGARPASAAVGSLNLDVMAMRRNYENAIRSTDPDLVAAVERLFVAQQQRGIVASDDLVAGWRGIATWRERLNLRY